MQLYHCTSKECLSRGAKVYFLSRCFHKSHPLFFCIFSSQILLNSDIIIYFPGGEGKERKDFSPTY